MRVKSWLLPSTVSAEKEENNAYDHRHVTVKSKVNPVVVWKNSSDRITVYIKIPLLIMQLFFFFTILLYRLVAREDLFFLQPFDIYIPDT